MPACRHIVRIAAVLLTLGLIAGCNPATPPDVSEIQAQPSTTIGVGETASLSVTASGSDLSFAWTAVRGTLSDPTRPSVIYTAPDAAGPDTVTLTVTSGGITTVRSITFQVIAPTPTPPPTPTDTPLPTDTPRPTDTPVPSATPTPPPPIACNHRSITENLFPSLATVPNQFPFYGPLGDPRFVCFGVYDVVHTPPLAVRIEYQSEVTDENYAFWGIGTPLGYDASAFDQVCFWAYAERPNQTVRLQMKDTANVEKGVFINIPQAGAWNPFCVSLSDFAAMGLDLKNTENVTLGFNKDTQSATVWVDDFEFR
jgi:hypothetical protein